MTRVTEERPWVAGRGNPFATRYTAPGRLPPLTGDGGPLDVAAIVAAIPRRGAAAIVGPHGSGKTTLLVTLVSRLQDAGRPVALVRSTMPAALRTLVRTTLRMPAGGTVAVDSWERLGPLARGVLRSLATWRGCGLLVTAHRAGGLPVLATCRTTPRLLRAVVDLLPDAARQVSATEIAGAFSRHAGNLRDALAALYDRFEERRIPSAPDSTCSGGTGGTRRAGRNADTMEIHESEQAFSDPGAPRGNLG